MLEKILGNVPEDFGECYQRFQEMLLKIPGNVIKDSGECSRGFPGMLLKILGNVQEDSGKLIFDLFLEIFLVFYQFLLLNCYKTMEKNNY